MAVSPTPDQLVTGTVTSVNPKGVKLEGEGEWRNFSKYAPDIIPPARGGVVTLTMDRAGFIRAVAVTEGSQGTHTSRVAPTTSTARDTTITRLAVLKAAAEFAAARLQVKSGEVLKIAASWERWILRDAGDLDLTDAF